MGCNKSTIRVGPAMLAGKKVKGGKSVQCLQQTRQNVWRRMVRFRQVKVEPAKPHIGGGDNPEFEPRSLQQPESGLYTGSKPATDLALTSGQQSIKTAWGEANPTQAKILLELQDLGIINFHASASGAISFSVGQPSENGGLLPPRRLPARLTRLDRVPMLPDTKKAEKLEKDMKAAEARRKCKQDVLKERLRAHSRLGTQHQKVAAEADRVLKQKAAEKIAEKEAAFQKNLDRQREARLERSRAKSRAGDQAKEYVQVAEMQAKVKAKETIAKKQVRFEAHKQQLEAERMDHIRAKSRMEEHAKEIADVLAKDCKEKAAETLAKKQKTVESNMERHERFRTQRVILNERHRENIRRALARRMAEEDEQADNEMDYEIETAQDSEDDEDFFDPELEWLI